MILGLVKSVSRHIDDKCVSRSKKRMREIESFQEIRWALQDLGIWDAGDIKLTRPVYWEFDDEADHRSMFLSFPNMDSLNAAAAKLAGQWIVGISRPQNPKRSMD